MSKEYISLETLAQIEDLRNENTVVVIRTDKTGTLTKIDTGEITQIVIKSDEDPVLSTE